MGFYRAVNSTICERLKGQKVLIFKPDFSISTTNAYYGLNESNFVNKDRTLKKINSFRQSLIANN